MHPDRESRDVWKNDSLEGENRETTAEPTQMEIKTTDSSVSLVIWQSKLSLQGRFYFLQARIYDMVPSMRQDTLCRSEKDGIKEHVNWGEIQIVNAIAFFLK